MLFRSVVKRTSIHVLFLAASTVTGVGVALATFGVEIEDGKVYILT